MASPANILIIKLSALGDLIQADGAFRDIRAFHPDDLITVMTTPVYRPFMERSPWVDQVLVDPRASRFNLGRMLDLRKALFQRNFDRVYDLQQVGRTRFYYHWLFPRVEWLGDVPGCTYYLKRPDHSCAADHFARHLQSAGIPTPYTLHTDVTWMADDVTDILTQNELQPGYVLVIPGASAAHDKKRWPHFSDLAELVLRSGRRVVTVPGPAEREQYGKLPGDMLIGADGYLDYFALAGIARRAAYVVGNDTGPTHIAAHLGCQGLALYGAHTSPQSTGIQHTRFSWLEARDLADLSVETVWRKIESDIGE